MGQYTSCVCMCCLLDSKGSAPVPLVQLAMVGGRPMYLVPTSASREESFRSKDKSAVAKWESYVDMTRLAVLP